MPKEWSRNGRAYRKWSGDIVRSRGPEVSRDGVGGDTVHRSNGGRGRGWGDTQSINGDVVQVAGLVVVKSREGHNANRWGRRGR